jgi:integrase/recombinase XerD
MKLRNLSPRTIRAYMSHMERYSKLFGKSPASMGEVEIRKYLRYLREERKVSWSNINVAYNAIRFFYIKTLDRKFCVEKIPRPKIEHKLPIVLSKTEVKSIIEASANLKYKTIFMALYSTGCRLSEVSHLKVTDIDSKRMQVRRLAYKIMGKNKINNESENVKITRDKGVNSTNWMYRNFNVC